VDFVPVLKEGFEFCGPFVSMDIEKIKAHVKERDAFVDRFIDASKRKPNSIVEIPYFCIGPIYNQFTFFSRERSTFLGLVTQEILNIYKKIKAYAKIRCNHKPFLMDSLKGIGKSFCMAIISMEES